VLGHVYLHVEGNAVHAGEIAPAGCRLSILLILLHLETLLRG